MDAAPDLLPKAPGRAWVVATVMLGTMSTWMPSMIVTVELPALLAEMQLGGAFGVNVLAVILDQRLAMLSPEQALRAYHERVVPVALAFTLAIVPAWAVGRRRH